jgi:hypothetical protein
MGSEQFQSSLENTDGIFPLVIPFVIDMMNSVHSLPTNLPIDFTDKIYSFANSVGKNGTSLFFLLYFNYFFSTVIPSVNTKGIFMSVKSVGNLPTKIFYLYFRLYLSIFLVVSLILTKLIR